MHRLPHLKKLYRPLRDPRTRLLDEWRRFIKDEVVAKNNVPAPGSNDIVYANGRKEGIYPPVDNARVGTFRTSDGVLTCALQSDRADERDLLCPDP